MGLLDQKVRFNALKNIINKKFYKVCSNLPSAIYSDNQLYYILGSITFFSLLYGVKNTCISLISIWVEFFNFSL